MGLFSRFSKSKHDDDDAKTIAETTAAEDSDATAEADETVDAADDEEEALLEKAAPFDRVEKGPFDAAEDFPEVNRLDLGALKVPVVDGMQVRLDTDEESQRILAVTLVHAEGGVQLQAFATPRSEGLWNTVRGQLAASVESQGGDCSVLHTGLGKELSVTVPATTDDGRPASRAMRFAGIDGPRWFIRAIFSGRAVTDDEVRAELSALVRGVVVDRGVEAMAPRELIVLTAPRVNEEGELLAEDTEEELNPFERGPEITEIR